MWATHAIIDFWSNWPILGPIEGIWRSSVIDNSNMVKFAHELFDNTGYKRGLILSAVDINTGEIVIFDETISAEHRAMAVIASASIPLMFPPVSDLNPHQMVVDGGLFSNLEMDESILKCREKGYDDEHIIVDMILCFDKVVEVEHWDLKSAKYESAYGYYKRRDALTNFYYYYEEVIRVIRGFPKVQFRHLITPKAPLGDSYVPIFDGAEEVNFLIERGLEDGEWYFGPGESGQETPRVKSTRSNFEKIRDMIRMEDQIEL
jgi:hypothetical protein